MEIKDYYKIILGIIDNIHDFYDLDKEQNFILYKNYKKFYLKQIFKIIKDINIYPFNNILFIAFFNSNNKINKNNINMIGLDNLDYQKTLLEKIKKDEPYDVNYDKYKLALKNKILNDCKQQQILELDKLNQNIVNNFDKIFDINPIKQENIDITIKNVKDTINEHQKILLRQSLYFLIKNKDKELIDFFIKYLNLDILSQEIQSLISEKINENLSQFDIKNNVNYPLTFFDDTSNGLDKLEFRFKILNSDKNLIDQATVESIDKYIENYTIGKHQRQIFINNKENIMALKVPKENLILNYLDATFYLENNKINCKFDSINIKVIKNIVGRKIDGNEFGLYQTIIEINKIFDLVDKEIINFNEKIKLEKNEEYYIYINNIINKIHDKFDKFILTINTLNLIITNIKNITIGSDNEIMKKLKNLNYFKNKSQVAIDNIKEIYKTIQSYNISSKINNYSDYKNVFINLKKIYDYINLNKKLDYFFDFFEINKNAFEAIELILFDEEYINTCLYFNKNLKLYVKDNKISNLGQELLFYSNIQFNNYFTKISEILFHKDLYIQLNNIYNNMNNDNSIELDNILNMCKGCVSFLLFGAKRYGDWIQSQISEKYYMMLQTTDLFCKLYSYIIGGPVIIDNDNNEKIIYNYIPNDCIEKVNNNDFIKKIPNINKLLKTKKNNNYQEQILSNINSDDKLLYEGLNTIETGSIKRYYYKKYLKYKIKYNNLKNQL